MRAFFLPSRFTVGVLLLSLCSVAGADEICGIPSALDDLFKDGFEIPPVALVMPPAMRTSRSVIHAPNQIATAPTVTITFPTAGSVPGNSVAVAGTYTGPADTGIVVNGQIAYVSGGTFLVPGVHLSAGSNTLTATATTLVGDTGTAGVSVTPDGIPAAAILSVGSPTGYAPYNAVFSAGIPGGVVASQTKIDFDGNGSDDFTTTNPSAPLIHSYTVPGLYTARLTVIDNTTTPTPTTYVAYRRVLVQDVVEVRETLCAVYGHVRTNLAAGDVPTAVLAFSTDSRAHYQSFFGSISSPNLPVAAGRLGTIADGIIGVDFAHLKVVKMYQGSMASFPLTLNRDDDGVWRIESM